MALSQANQHEIDDLMSEIAFQRVLLSSIDDSVENRGEAENEVRVEITTLEKQLRALRRPVDTTTSASQSASTPLSQPLASRPSPSKPHTDTAMEEISRNVLQNGYQAREPRRNLASTSSTSSTPDSYDSLPSPSEISLPTRKRSHSTHLDGGLKPFEDNKSRRTSPSPFMIDPATPFLSSGDEEFEKFDKEFFNGAILQQQKAQEEKIKQEKMDAEFARLLADGGTANPSPAVRPSAPSAFDRLSGMRPLPRSPASSSSAQDARTFSSRKLPWATNSASAVKSEPRFMTSSAKRHEPSNDSGMGSDSKSNGDHGFKIEASSSNFLPGAFIDDDASTASDSDIEIISSESFHDNGRHVPAPNASRARLSGGVSRPPQRMQGPNFSPEAQTAGEAALRRVEQASTTTALQRAMSSSQSVPNWMQDSLSLPSSAQNLPGSYPRPGIGMSSNSAYAGTVFGRPQAYSGGAGNFVYSGARGGMYPGSTGGHMQHAAPFLGHSLSNLAGGIFSPGFMGHPIDIDGEPDPFQGLGDQRDLINNNFNRPHDARMGEQYDYIVNDPRKTNEEIKALLENIRPDTDLPAENREGTPEGLVYPLYEHQKLALTWMKSMEEGTNKGGILADDMGLGKTISTLALMLSRLSSDRLRKTTLIVGPVALVKQWEREIRTKVKGSHKFSVFMLHGQLVKKTTWDRLKVYDVVLTTYGTLGAEFKRLEKWLNDQKLAGNPHNYDRKPMNQLFPLLGEKSKFYRVILDEAQYIKNKNTNASRATKHLQALTRFCLTGTPMMNNIGELYSLIQFLRIKPYNEWARFQEAFGKLAGTVKAHGTRKEAENAMRKLQAVLKAILLRRTKQSFIDGKPIINLPPKTEEIQHVVFNEDEQAFYNALESKTQIQFNKYVRANTVGKNYSNVLVLLLRLRQACCHPHLIMDFEEAPAAGVDLTPDAMIELAKTLTPDVIARLQEAEGFECPVCYDGAENPTIVLPCGHDTCAECLSKISDQAVMQNENGDEGAAMLKCPTCRGKIELRKVIDYATFKKVHMSEEVREDGVASVNGDSETESGTDSDSASENDSDTGDDADFRGNLRGFVVPDDIERTDDEDDEDDGEDGEDGEDGDDEAERVPKRKSKSKKTKKDKRRKSKGKEKEGEKQHVSISMLKKKASKTAAGRRKYMKYLRKNWQPSAKVDKCVELLEQFQNDGQKTIIFSQFVTLLDLVQVPIMEKSWKCERYDGSMNANHRDDAIMRFTDKPDVKIMLVSLKAGNAGLNLVAASRVIILDPFWNPFIEMQAVDRAYRIGQQNSVEVHRILIEKTVEDRIIELQEQKRKLVNSALDEGASKSLGRLSVGQLSYLFGVGGSAS